MAVLQYQNLFPQGMGTLQGGNQIPIYQPPSPNWRPSLQTIPSAMYSSATLPSAMNQPTVQLNPYNITTPNYDRQQQNILRTYDNSDTRLQKMSEKQDGDGQIFLGNNNYSTLYGGDVQPKNPFIPLSAQTQVPPETQPPVTEQPPPTAEQQQTETPPTSKTDSTSVADAIKNLQEAQVQLSNYTKSENQTPENKILRGDYPQRGSIPAGLLPQLNQQNYLDADSMQTLGNLYVAKKVYRDYDDIQRIAAEKLSQKDLSEKDRAEYQKSYDNAVRIKENAANYGQMTRQNLLQLGVNADDYGLGSGNTYDEATQSINFLQQRDMRHFLNLPSGKELEKQRQQEYKDAGVSRSWARFLARQDREEIDRDLSGQYLGAMQTYGLNADGSLNDYGFALASKWAKDDPTSANLYLNGYATPNAQYQAQNQIYNTMLNNDSAERRTAASLAEDWNKFLGNLGLAQDTLEQRKVEHADDVKYKNATLELNVARLNADQAAKLAKQQFEIQKFLYDKDPVIQAQIATYQADLLFGEEDSKEKQEWKRTKLNPHYNSGKVDESATKHVRNTLQQIKQEMIYGEVDGDGNEVAKNTLEQLKAELKDSEKDLKGKLDSKEYNDAIVMTYYYDKVLNGKMSIYDVYDQYWRMTNDGRDPNTTENGDPIWYIKMSNEERKAFDDYYARERGLRKKKTPSATYVTPEIQKGVVPAGREAGDNILGVHFDQPNSPAETSRAIPILPQR